MSEYNINSKEFVMYIFVNNDLNMGKGKIAAQVGHLVETIIEELVKAELTSTKKKSFLEDYNIWKRTGRKKIILKATEEEIKQLSQLDGSRYIVDAGLTQIPSGSMTVVGFLPSSTKKNIFSKFKLL
jgi:PTH2 family peptidyl-tRNA hydrolase